MHNLEKGIVCGMMFTLLLVGLVSFAANIQTTKALPATIYVDDGNVAGPWDGTPEHPYQNITSGLEHASEGDTIFVYNGTYYENVVVNKTISLEGENRETTIINAWGESGIKVVANGTGISGFTVCNATSYSPVGGAIVVGGFDNVISDNIVERNRQGITLSTGGNNTLRDNMIVNSSVYGLRIWSSNNTFRNNALVNNSFHNLDLENPYQDIDISNTVNGKPIVYLLEKQNLTVSPDVYPQEIGMLYLLNSTNMVVEGFNISYSENSDYSGYDYNIVLYLNVNVTIRNNIISHGAGIFSSASNRDVFIFNNTLHDNRKGIYGQSLRYTYITQNIFYNNNDGILILSGSYNTIWENTFYNNTQEVLACFGIHLIGSQYTVIVGNNFTLNDFGLRCESGSFNTVYGNNIINNSHGIMIVSGSIGNTISHNNIINNTEQVYVSGEQINIWDLGYPSGGNYWSDYNGTDLYWEPGQDEIGGDGVGDTAYVIDANNTDRYPLMGPINIFEAGVWNETEYFVDIVSNSTVSDFQFDVGQKSVSFNVEGDDGTGGFCRVAIPNDLLWAVDGWTITVGDQTIQNYTIIPNENLTYLYFTYNHSTQTVTIQGTNVIPEFLSSMALLGFLTLITVLLILAKKTCYKKAKT